MKPVAFDYARPRTLDEALAVVAEHGDDAAILAGGMSLGPMLNLRLVRPAVVVDINRVEGIDAVAAADGHVVTGAGVRQAPALRDTTIRGDVPLLARALPWVGHYQTRSRGTLAGSVAHADPSAEVPLALVALDGAIVLQSTRRRRTVAARDFFLGVLTTTRQPTEMVIALHWPRRRPGEGFGFEEVAERHGDFAIAAVAGRVRLGDGRLADVSVAVGGIEDRPLSVDVTAFHGAPASDETVTAMADHVASHLDPISDRAGSVAYRRALARTLTGRAMNQAIGDAEGGTP